MTQLLPSIPGDLLFPADVAFAPRSAAGGVNLAGFADANYDSTTLNMLGCLGRRPSVRLAAGLTPPIRDLLAAGGLVIEEDVHTYDTAEAAAAATAALVADGWRIAGTFPPGDALPDSACATPRALWARLNSKRLLADLVPAEHLARRAVLPPAAVMDGPIRPPFWLKLAADAPTGGGFAVRFCADYGAIAPALAELSELAPGAEVIVEEHVPCDATWCAHLVLTDAGVILPGAAEQILSAPGRQSGSIIDPANPFPAPDLLRQIGERVWATGYRGPAALDIGRATDGRIVVFDPNFRPNASTPAVLLYPAAVQRSGMPVLRTTGGDSPLPLADFLRALAGPVVEGWFVPLRAWDPAAFPPADGKIRLQGFVMAAGRDEAARADARLRGLIGVA